ncbi:hypothetical protein CSC79_04835 [Pseudoalteromonas sp. 3D05]|nr:hypothetical protein CSC79_04835 [Pseudoalteromonas sp. 3D05]
MIVHYIETYIGLKYIPKPPQDTSVVGIKSDLDKALILTIVVLLLKSITQYKSLLNQAPVER